MQARRNYNRTTRINEEIRKEVSYILQNLLKDPRIDTLTSVVKVDTTKDLKYCKLFVSVLGDDEKRSQTKVALKSAAGFIRRELAARLNLRNTPEIRFIMDQSIEYGVHMSKLIDDVNRDSLEKEGDKDDQADE